MNIESAHTVERGGETFFVYSGTCDNKATKWITRSKWDFKLSVQLVNGQPVCTDSRGQPIMVWESDEDEYYEWNVDDNDGAGAAD